MNTHFAARLAFYSMASLCLLPSVWVQDANAAPPSPDATATAPLEAASDTDPLVSHAYTLAELHYQDGLRVVFSYDAASEDFGLLQEGKVNVHRPVIGEVDSMLGAYLTLTPDDQPVPEELLDEPEVPREMVREALRRGVAVSAVRIDDLEQPELEQPEPAQLAASGPLHGRCTIDFFPWQHWNDAQLPSPAPKTYYSSSFGGKRRYAFSGITNCNPKGAPGWLWARHRIYYKSTWGFYIKHFDSKVAPDFWETKHKGSIKRYRAVKYTDGWDAAPNCSGCRYTREGLFAN